MKPLRRLVILRRLGAMLIGIVTALLVVLAISILAAMWLFIGWPAVYYYQYNNTLGRLQQDTIAIYESIHHPEIAQPEGLANYPTPSLAPSMFGYWISYQYVTPLTYSEVVDHYSNNLSVDDWLMEEETYGPVFGLVVDGVPSQTNQFAGHVLYRRDEACLSVALDWVDGIDETTVDVTVWLDVDGQPYSPWRPPRFAILANTGFFLPFDIYNCPRHVRNVPKWIELLGYWF